MTEKEANLSSGNDAANEAFQLLKSFFTERKTPRVALANLREKVEIGISIAGMVSCAVFRQGSDVMVERREAVNPDFIFSIQPETVSILAHQTPDEIGAIGLGIIKEMLAGDIQVQMPGGLMSVIRNGYVDVVTSGGAPVMKMLGQLGFSSPTKILGLFRNLRR